MQSKSIYAALPLIVLLCAPAFAGNGTVTGKDASGTTQTYDTVTDGVGHHLPKGAICDQNAGAQCLSITGGHAAKTELCDTSGNNCQAISAGGAASVDGSAVTQPVGVRSSTGTAVQPIVCDSSIVYDASTNGSTELVALSSGKTVYVCGYSFFTGASATNVKLIYGTGTACATGTAAVTPAYQLAANDGIVDNQVYGNSIHTAVSNALCINASAGNAVQGRVSYTQF